MQVKFTQRDSATAGFEAGFATADITPPAGWGRAGNYTELASIIAARGAPMASALTETVTKMKEL